MITQRFLVSGMTCAACVKHVHNALAALPGVHEVVVNLQDGSAVLAVDREVDRDLVREALEAEDYALA